MLIAKGYRVVFKMQDGKTVKPPASYAMLHDEDGRDWPRCSALIIPIHPRGTPLSGASKARTYFGHTPVAASAVLPPRSLGEWHRVGPIAQVLYSRRRPRGLPASHQADYYHPIEKGTATLYRRDRWYRMELGPGCQWNWRGIIKP